MTVNPLAPVGPAWFRDLHNIEHRQFNFDHVNPDANGNFDFSSRTYLESLDFIASWVAGLSAIYLTVLLIVGLARCCGCCKPKTRKPSRHGFLTIMLFLVGAAALVCCIVGSHIIESATEDVDTMAATLQQPVTALTALAAATNTSLPGIVRRELNKAPNSSQYILELDSVVALMTSVVVKSGEIANDVPSLDVSTRTHDARVALHWTRVGLSIFFSLFLAFVFLLPCTRRPCVRWLYLIFAFLFLVFLSIGRGGAFGALVGLSDMCHNVTGQILIIADNSDVEYYLACNASVPSPSEPLITDALADVTTAATNMNDIIAFLAERHLDVSAARGIARELSGFNSTLVSSLPGLSCEAIQPTYTHIVDEGCWTMSKLGLAIVCLAFGLGLLLCASMITVIVREPTSALPAYAELEMEESAPLLRKSSTKVATNDFSGYKIGHPLNY